MADRKNWADETFAWEDDAYVAKARRHKYSPPKTDKAILETYLRASQGQSNAEAVAETAKSLDLPVPRVAKAVQKAKLKDEAKALRREIAEEVYKEKVPMMQDIVGLCLAKLKDFVSAIEPEEIETIQDAKALKDIACDLNTMLRLELGQSTDNIAINAQAQYTIEHTQKLLSDLRPKDPIFFAGLLDGPATNDAAAPATNDACGGAEQALRPNKPSS